MNTISESPEALDHGMPTCTSCGLWFCVSFTVDPDKGVCDTCWPVGKGDKQMKRNAITIAVPLAVLLLFAAFFYALGPIRVA